MLFLQYKSFTTFKVVIFIALILLVAVFYCPFLSYDIVKREDVDNVVENIPNVIFGDGSSGKLLVSDTEKTRETGLSGMKSLGDYIGMLFIFEKTGLYGFWMKDMLFDIDILWLDSEGNVVYLVEGVKKDSYPEIFYPNKNAKYVLELSSGDIKKRKIYLGQKIDFSLQ